MFFLRAWGGQVRQGWKTEQKLKQPAWDEFLAVCRVLKRYDALKDAEVSKVRATGGGGACVCDNPARVEIRNIGLGFLFAFCCYSR